MTTDELNAIVKAVMDELEKAGVDFNFKAETPQADDLVYVMRGTSDKYQGITVKWQNLLNIIVKKATDAKDEAVSAKDIALETLATIQGIESNVSTMKSSVDASEANVASMKASVETSEARVTQIKAEAEQTLAEATQTVSGKADKTYVDGELAKKADITYVDNGLATKADKSELAVERARIDSLSKLSEGSTTGDAELIDIRIGADGVTYRNAGDAVRTQISNLKGDLEYCFDSEQIQESLYIPLSMTPGYIIANGTVMESTQYSYSQKIKVVKGDVINVKNNDNGNETTRFRYLCAYKNNEVIAEKGSDSNLTEYIVPNGVNYVVISIDTSSYHNYSVKLTEVRNKYNLSDNAINKNQDEKLNEVCNLFEKVNGLRTEYIPLITNSGYVVPNGSVHSWDGYWYTQKISVSDGDIIYLRNNDTGVEDMRFRCVCAYNGDSAISEKGIDANQTSYIVPQGITHIVLTYVNTYVNCSVKRVTYQLVLSDIARNLNDRYVVNPSIIVPKKSIAIVGHEWNMYYNNVIKGLSDLYYVFCNGINGKSYEDFLRYTPTDSDVGTHTVTINIYSKSTGELVTSKSFELVVIEDLNITKKVIFIGDSLTNEGTYINEIQNKLSNGNIISLGTLTDTATSGYNITHEGRAGWSAYNYVEQSEYAGYVNAFWNPDTSSFDFSYYMNTNNFNEVDCVMINLGTNGVNYVDRTCNAIDTMIASIHSYNPNIKIIISLITPPCTQDGCGHHNGMFTSYGWKLLQLELVKKYIEKYDEISTNVYVSEVYFNIDTKNDFPTKIVQVSARNPKEITIQNNNVHPNKYGYLKFADVYYNNLIYRLSN